MWHPCISRRRINGFIRGPRQAVDTAWPHPYSLGCVDVHRGRGTYPSAEGFQEGRRSVWLRSMGPIGVAIPGGRADIWNAWGRVPVHQRGGRPTGFRMGEAAEQWQGEEADREDRGAGVSGAE
jgi:hypothetical protein